MNNTTVEQLEKYKNTYDYFDGISSNEFDAICDELIKYKQLEEQLGCPFEVRCKVVIGTVVYSKDGTEYEVDHCEVEGFAGINDTYYLDDPYLYDWDSSANFKWKDYKKTWWLKKDKSE